MNAILSDFGALGPYLCGDRFDANLVIDYQRQDDVAFRNDLLIEICRGKRVLHIGCCDHVPLVADKIRTGQWVHKLLTDCSGSTLGIDIDREAVDACKKISGYSNIIVGDITDEARIREISSGYFDVVIFGEVVEHISNPVMFLERFRKNYKSAFDKIVITVPNAFRGGNLRGSLKQRETINSDHRFFFTPYTISKVAVDAGFKPLSITMATFTKAGAIKRYLLRKKPLLAEDIILTAV